MLVAWERLRGNTLIIFEWISRERGYTMSRQAMLLRREKTAKKQNIGGFLLIGESTLNLPTHSCPEHRSWHSCWRVQTQASALVLTLILWESRSFRWLTTKSDLADEVRPKNTNPGAFMFFLDEALLSEQVHIMWPATHHDHAFLSLGPLQGLNQIRP